MSISYAQDILALPSTGGGTGTGSGLDPIDDAGNYSTTPYTIAASTFNIHRFFTGGQNQNIHFPQNLSVTPAAHGRLTAPSANTLSIRAATGVSINGVAGNGTTSPIAGTIIWTVPAAGTVEWVVRAPNTIEILGDTTAELALTGPLNLVSHKIIPGAPVAVTTGTRTYGADDSGKCFVIQTTAGTQTIPAGLLSGWEVTILNNTASSVTIAGPGGNTTVTTGQVCNVKYWSGTTIKVTVGNTVGIN
jgi:hypothetical protein